MISSTLFLMFAVREVGQLCLYLDKALMRGVLVQWVVTFLHVVQDGEVPLDWALEPQRKARMQLAIARGKRLRANGSRVPPIRPCKYGTFHERLPVKLRMRVVFTVGTSSERGPPKLCTASEGSSASAVRRLLTDGAPVNESNSVSLLREYWYCDCAHKHFQSGQASLLWAAWGLPRTGDEECIDLLIAAGADPTAQDDVSAT